MTITTMTTRSVVIHPHGMSRIIDPYGNVTETDGELVATTAYLEQTDAIEIIVGQETYIAEWLMVFRPGTIVDGSDQVEVPDLAATFEVIGDPNRPRRPASNIEHHVEVRLRQVT